LGGGVRAAVDWKMLFSFDGPTMPLPSLLVKVVFINRFRR
jgi:hypothetical protein